MKVKVYGKSVGCAQCTMTRRYLKDLGVKFEEINLDLLNENDPEYKQFVAIYGRDVPVVVSEKKVIRGFRPDELGELAELV